MMHYPYTAKDMRSNPTMYMYAPFEGAAFLQAYVQSRQHALLHFRNSIQEGENPLADALVKRQLSKLLLYAQKSGFPLPRENSIETKIVLQQCLIHALSGNVDHLPKVDEWVEILLRKIEVSKRLYSAYGADLRPVDRQDGGPEAYALFAALLALRLDGGARLKRLSTLLKLNDFLIFLDDGWRDNLIVQAAIIVALEVELNAVRNLDESIELFDADA